MPDEPDIASGQPDLHAIRERWDTSHDRSADDYTDEGCRVLAEAAFRDVPILLDEVERLRTRVRALHSPREWANGTWCEECGAEFPCPTRRIVGDR